MGEKTKYLMIGMLILAIAQLTLICATDNQTSNETIIQTIENETMNTNSTIEIEDPEINIDILDSTITLGEETEFGISINYDGDILSTKIEYGDNNAEFLTINSQNQYAGSYEYLSPDLYKIKITVKTSDGTNFIEESETIKIEEPEIEDEDPRVTLISPSQNYTSKQDKVTFTFKVTDDKKINFCTFELYKKENGLKKLEYTDNHANPPKNEEIALTLEEFEDGNYSWYITCEDNKSQEDTESRDLIIKTVNHEREKEILTLLEDIDNFLEKESTLSPEEKEAISELKILENIRYYKKRLLQINQDLGNNLKYITDSTLREQRKIETYVELDEIKEKIPYDIKILNSETFVKNSLTNPMESIAQRYIETQNIELSQNKIKKLAKQNEAMQSKLTTKVSIKQIEIKYNKSNEKITLISKNIQISDPEIKRIIEVFPENFETEIEFITKTKELGKNLYEINLNELENFEIKYLTKENTNTGIIKETETIIFEEQSISSNGITGFSIFEGGINNKSIYIGIGLSIILSLLFSYKGSTLNTKKWKRDENSTNTIRWINQANENIKEKNIAKAKEKYHKIKEIFKLLPEEFKQKFYNKIEKIRIEIDKNEIKDLIREYENAKKENRTIDANKLYTQISKKYKNLPKKYQIKVYERIIK